MALGRSRGRWCVLLLLLGGMLCGPVANAAQEPAEETPAEEAPAGLKPRLDWGLEAKANFRHSEDNRFPVPFPFDPSMPPVGQTQGFEQTVNPAPTSSCRT